MKTESIWLYSLIATLYYYSITFSFALLSLISAWSVFIICIHKYCMGSYGSVKHYERIKFYIGKTISSVKYVRWSVKKKTKKKKKKKKNQI